VSVATRITNAFDRLVSWAVIKCASRHPDPRALLVDAAYKELERKAQRVHEVKEMISELEDAVKAGTISTVINGTQDGVIGVLKAAVKTTASETELVKDGSNKVTVTDSAITHTVDGATRAQITTSGMAITGSITVTGTVDGVDVAALKTTVDGITAGSATEPKFWAFYLAD